MEKERSKYLLNVEGKKFRANTLIELIYKVLRKQHS
jgi:hypothetical protein